MGLSMKSTKLGPPFGFPLSQKVNHFWWVQYGTSDLFQPKIASPKIQPNSHKARNMGWSVLLVSLNKIQQGYQLKKRVPAARSHFLACVLTPTLFTALCFKSMFSLMVRPPLSLSRLGSRKKKNTRPHKMRGKNHRRSKTGT